MNIQSYVRRGQGFLPGLSILIFAGILLLIFYGKSACFISLNSYHAYYLDVFFINYTFFGDGIFSICLMAAFLFFYKNKRQFLALLVSFLFAGLGTQIIKNLFNAPRPKIFFEAGQYLHFIDGVSLANNCSFPSGHTATAFAIAAVLMYFIKNKNQQKLLLLAAALVGYSRIYLAQHFLLDVLAGAVLGTISGFLGLYFALKSSVFQRIICKIQFFTPAKKDTVPATLFSN